jgi:3-phosphoinositide dependent protein kinase-1
MKPENVLIGEDKHLRLIDFGDSKEFDLPGEKTVAEQADAYMKKKTNPESDDEEDQFEMPDPDVDPEARGTFVGTPLYVSPEMLDDNLAIPASDLWALGVMVFNMHTGKMPFDGQQ